MTKAAATQPAVQYAVNIVELEKSFRRQTLQRKGYTTIKSALFGVFTRGARKDREAAVTHAVRGLTMRVPRGASIGVIGRNGSGKSTLLKLITGIYKPTRGTISVNGRVAALIELGAGFHPDFTGRENLYLAGIMLGLTRAEIDRRYDTIVDFAGLREVMDDPVRTYSSGMFMRLGFSVAVHTDPDILLVDEVLAVGDAAFIRKCKDRVSELRSQGKTLLLVSHDLEAVERWCDEAIWLHKGEVRDRGEPRRVIDHYREFLEHGENEELIKEQTHELGVANGTVAINGTSAHPQDPQRWGSREIEISHVAIKQKGAAGNLIFHPDDALEVEIKFKINDRTALTPPAEQDAPQDVVFGIAINRSDGTIVHGTNTDIERVRLPSLADTGIVRYRIDRLGLVDGAYVIDVAAHRFDGYPFDYHKSAVKFAVRSAGRQVGMLLPPSRWDMEQAAQ